MRTPGQRHTRALVAAFAGLSLVATACGSDDVAESPDTESPDTATPDTESPDTATPDTESPDTATPDTAATATPDTGADAGAPSDDVPERVISLSPTHTEIMFAIGAGDQLVAVDEYSNHPAEAVDLPHDLSGFEPNVEAIASYDPDLVLIGGDFTGVGDQLADLEITSWDGPAATTFDDTYSQIEQLGEITGHADEADELVSSMQADIAAAADAVSGSSAALTYYHELGPELFTATSTTFIGQVYGLFGLENIADPLEADAGQYPQMSAEALVEADPDLIFLADTKCCGETAATVSERDGFDTIAAVRNGDIAELDDDIASRWGPRIVDYVEAVAAAVGQAADPA